MQSLQREKCKGCFGTADVDPHWEESGNHLSSEKYYSALPMSQMPSINRLSFGDQIHPIHAVPAAPAISEMPSINHSPLADPIRRIHAVFAHADPEGKGYLDVRGFENALQSLGVRLEYKDVLDSFGKEDRGQTGHIEPEQFVPLLTVKKYQWRSSLSELQATPSHFCSTSESGIY